MNQAATDLDAYFCRIGYEGPRAPTLAVLRELCRLQTRAIPFENLDPLLGTVPALELASVQDKLVGARRGGYCYEQNGLMQSVLKDLGFETRSLAARVLLNAPPGTLTARTHMLLLVRIEGRDWLADVGFGRATPTGPLLLEAGLEQETPHESYRIESADDEFDLRIRIARDWVLMYRFNLTGHLPADYAVYNHYVATAPGSFFRRSIVAALAAQDGRHVLFDDRLAFLHRDGRREETLLPDAETLIAVLDETFGISVTDPAALSRAFARILASKPG